MGRPHRFDPENAWHHVMNRGIDRQEVFLTARDGCTFESLLADGYDEFGVEVHAYALMPNHFHLLLHCPDGGLSGYMQRLSSRYTKYLNDRRGGDGPIFRGRFRSLMVDSQRYMSAAGRYIHRNPLATRPSVALDQYRWSSFRYYCGLVSAPAWLHLSILGEMHGGPTGYREYVQDDVSLRSDGPIEWAIALAIAESGIEDFTSRSRIDRTIAVGMLVHAGQLLGSRLEGYLAFPSADARRYALRRARSRLEREPELAGVVQRAIELAS